MKIHDVKCQTQDCSYVQSQLVEVKDVKATGGAFCALKGDGTVVTWGTSAKEMRRLGSLGGWGG